MPSFPPRQCYVELSDVKLDKSFKFVNNTVILQCGGRRKYVCYMCLKKFDSAFDLYRHKSIHDENENIEDYTLDSEIKRRKSKFSPNISSHSVDKNDSRKRRNSASSKQSDNTDSSKKLKHELVIPENHLVSNIIYNTENINYYYTENVPIMPKLPDNPESLINNIITESLVNEITDEQEVFIFKDEDINEEVIIDSNECIIENEEFINKEIIAETPNTIENEIDNEVASKHCAIDSRISENILKPFVSNIFDKKFIQLPNQAEENVADWAGHINEIEYIIEDEGNEFTNVDIKNTTINKKNEKIGNAVRGVIEKHETFKRNKTSKLKSRTKLSSAKRISELKNSNKNRNNNPAVMKSKKKLSASAKRTILINNSNKNRNNNQPVFCPITVTKKAVTESPLRTNAIKYFEKNEEIITNTVTNIKSEKHETFDKCTTSKNIAKPGNTVKSSISVKNINKMLKPINNNNESEVTSWLNFKCVTCDFYFEIFKKFVYHSNHKKSCIYYCSICNKTFTSKEDMCEDMCRHLFSFNFFSCAYCNSYFFSFDSLRTHLISDHKFSKDKITHEDLLNVYGKIVKSYCPSVYLCQICSNIFESRKNLQIHMDTQHEIKQVPRITSK